MSGCATERDSRKDEAVVLIFIFATAGLLIWAAAKPWVGKWVEVRRECTLRCEDLANGMCRVRESAVAIYRSRVRGIPEGADKVLSLSDFATGGSL